MMATPTTKRVSMEQQELASLRVVTMGSQATVTQAGMFFLSERCEVRGLQNAMIYHDIRSVMKLRSVYCTFVYCFFCCCFGQKVVTLSEAYRFLEVPSFIRIGSSRVFSYAGCRVPAVRFIRQGVQVAGRIHQNGICRVAGQDPKTTSDDIKYC